MLCDSECFFFSSSEMDAISGFASSVVTGVSGVATTIGQKVEKLASDYQVAEKFNGLADASEERFAILSGTYKKIVVEYLSALANGRPPPVSDSFFSSSKELVYSFSKRSPCFTTIMCSQTKTTRCKRMLLLLPTFSVGGEQLVQLRFSLRVLRLVSKSRKRLNSSPGSRRAPAERSEARDVRTL